MSLSRVERSTPRTPHVWSSACRFCIWESPLVKCKHSSIAIAMSPVISCPICLVFSRDEGLRVESWGYRLQGLASGRWKGSQATHQGRDHQRANSTIWAKGDLRIRGILQQGNRDPGKRWGGVESKLYLCVFSLSDQWLPAWSQLLFPMPKTKRRSLELELPMLFV